MAHNPPGEAVRKLPQTQLGQAYYALRPAARHGAGPRKIGELSKEVATGVAIRKGESDPPLRPDDAYPPWLFKLLEAQPTVMELQRLYEGPGLTLQQVR
jgi:hypothetical protein